MQRGLLAAVVAAVGVLVLVPARPAAPQIGGSKVAGMGITFPRVPVEDTLKDLNRMRGVGINSVTIDVWWNVDSSTSNDMHPDNTEHQITLSDETLRSAIRASKSAGMKVYFMPKLWCPNCQHTWRGILQPSNRATFYENYSNKFIAKYAALAREERVDVFVIGSEMNSTQTDTQWRDIATKAKQAFGGTISYVANWDTVREPPDPNFVIRFWDLIDEIGISAYYPLVDDARPSVSQIRSGWHDSSGRSRWKENDWLAGLTKLATQNPGKRIVFGEVGYLSATYAGVEPYNPACCSSATGHNGIQSQPDPAVQTNFYQALLETFSSQPWWGGVVWWEWYRVGDTAPEGSMSYTPRDKMTERFLKAWYVDGWRGGEYSSTQPATTTTTQGSSPGSTTTSTTEPGLSPAPYRPPPPNSAPLPMQPAPSPPPANSPPSSSPPSNGAPPGSPSPGQPQPGSQLSPAPPGYAPPQPAPTAPLQPAPLAPAPNSAPIIAAPPQASARAAPTTTVTTVPPTTTTSGPPPTWAGNAGAPPPTPTPAVVAGTPVVARSLGGAGQRGSRGWALVLGAFSILGPVLLGVVCLMVGSWEDQRNAAFAAAPLLSWHRGLPRVPGTTTAFDARPEPRRPRPPAPPPAPDGRVTVTARPRMSPQGRPFPGVSRSGLWGSRRATWPQRPPRGRRPAPRRPGGHR